MICKFKGCTLDAYNHESGLCVLHRNMKVEEEKVVKPKAKPKAKTKAETSETKPKKGIRARKKVIDKYED